MCGRWSPPVLSAHTHTPHRWHGVAGMRLVCVGMMMVPIVVLLFSTRLWEEERRLEGHGPRPLGRLVGDQRVGTSRVMLVLLLEGVSDQ